MKQQTASRFREEVFYPEAFFRFDELSVKNQKIFCALTFAGLLLTLTSALFSCTILEIKFPALKFWAEASLLVGAVLILVANFLSLEAKWYKYRAAAESIKTLTWLYRLNVDGFENKENIQTKIHALTSDLKMPKGKGTNIIAEFKDYVIPNEVNAIKSLYEENRLKEQKQWYSGKAENNRIGNDLIGACLVFAVILAICSFGSEKISTSLIATLLACIVALAQTKRFKELYAAYSTTLSDIQRVEILFESCNSPYLLTKVILQCELAFSREHVRWLARVENSACFCCPHKISAEKTVLPQSEES